MGSYVSNLKLPYMATLTSCWPIVVIIILHVFVVKCVHYRKKNRLILLEKPGIFPDSNSARITISFLSFRSSTSCQLILFKTKSCLMKLLYEFLKFNFLGFDGGAYHV